MGQAELAFSPRDRDWPGHLQLDFLEEDVQEIEAGTDDQEQEAAPRFSLVSGGKLCAAHPGRGGPEDAGGELELDEGGGQHQLALRAERALGLRQDATALSHVEVRSGAEYLLLRREHTGLEASRVAEAGMESLEPVVGREGRAAGYIDEAATRCGSDVAARVNALQLEAESELQDLEQLAPAGSTNVSLESSPEHDHHRDFINAVHDHEAAMTHMASQKWEACASAEGAHPSPLEKEGSSSLQAEGSWLEFLF
ncbi:hypothetical protein CYMTET_27604 [Cymbomonas tetramitiformis]|uniref:Uncharacterized protein n=1 Tax=Cymbomonas tetramitiformis TaxID=36881 RepID=A0AAE0FPQ7_9CHLO|nr:hypothetical protein CYMTET_27604 [Cymbomonas tetramitiformis]